MLVSKPKSLENKSSRKSLTSRFLCSPTLLTLSLCSALYLSTFLLSWQSLLSSAIPDWILSYTEVTADFLLARKKAEIVILGSSLSLKAFPPLDNNNELSLKRDLRDPSVPPVYLLATPGKLISDDYLLAKELLSRGRPSPELLVIAYSFRDFQDNLSISDLSQTPISRMLDYSQNKLHFGFNSFEGRSWQQFVEEVQTIADSHKSHYQAVAGLLKKKCQLYTANWRQKIRPGLETVTQRTADCRSVETLPDRTTNLAEYKKRYSPFNQARFDIQLKQLQALLELAKQNEQPVLLVNMPVTEENRKLITSTLADWQNPVRQLAASYNVDIGDFDQQPLYANLNGSDFSDSVHLNKSGQTKFIASFTPWLKQTRAYKQAFAID